MPRGFSARPARSLRRAAALRNVVGKEPDARESASTGAWSSWLLHEQSAVDLDRRAGGLLMGAPAALRVALGQPDRYSRMMIVNAGTEPTAAQLKRAGVVRIALVAGERDATAQVEASREAPRRGRRRSALLQLGQDRALLRRLECPANDAEALDWTLSEWR